MWNIENIDKDDTKWKIRFQQGSSSWYPNILLKIETLEVQQYKNTQYPGISLATHDIHTSKQLMKLKCYKRKKGFGFTIFIKWIILPS